MEIDSKDKAILNELQKNCKQSSRQLSKKLGIPATTIHQRIKKLEKEGVLLGYHAVVDPKKVGYNSSAIVFIQVEHFVPSIVKKKTDMPHPLEELSKLPYVQEAYALTGEDDLLIKVIGKDDHDIGMFVVDKLRDVPSIKRTRTAMIVFEGKNTKQIKF